MGVVRRVRRSYWLEHYSALATGPSDSDMKRQVGKTVGGEPVNDGQIDILVGHLRSTLNLQLGMSALDIGCGNGFVTCRLASYVSRVIAVDFTSSLLNVAASCNARSNISYILGDARNLPVLELSDVAWAWELLQHLDASEVGLFAKSLTRTTSNGAQIGLYGIPDKMKRSEFYDTAKKRLFAKKMDVRGTPHMGTWFEPKQLARRFENEGFEAEVVSQPPDFYTSFYRFDLLLRRQ